MVHQAGNFFWAELCYKWNKTKQKLHKKAFGLSIRRIQIRNLPVCCSCWVRQLLSTALTNFSTALLQRVARLAGASSRRERISEAGIRVNTSWIFKIFSAQNWSQKFSSPASIGCYKNDRNLSCGQIKVAEGNKK